MTEKLYYVDTLVPEYAGCRDVRFRWFRTEPPTAARPYSELIADYDEADHYAAYSRHCIDELLTEEEAAQLVAWLNTHKRVGTTTIKEVSLPIPNPMMGYGATAVGGGDDFYTLCEEPEYTLSFKVWGYFDLCGCVLADGSGIYGGRTLVIDPRTREMREEIDVEPIH